MHQNVRSLQVIADSGKVLCEFDRSIGTTWQAHLARFVRVFVAATGRTRRGARRSAVSQRCIIQTRRPDRTIVYVLLERQS